MSKNVLKITQGALMTAIFGVLVFLNRQTAGFVEQILVYIYPLPIAIYCARYGFKDGIPAAVAMMLLAFFLGSLNYAFYASTSLLIGYVCGGCIYRGMTAKKTLAFMMIIGIIVNLADILVVSELMGISFLDQVRELQDMSDMMLNGMSSFLPQSGGQADQFSQLFEAFFSVDMLKRFLIIATILTGILQAFLIYMFSTIIMRRMKIKVPKLNLKGGLQVPVWVGWAVGILTLAASILLRVSISRAAEAGTVLDLQSLSSYENVLLAVYMLGDYFLMIFGIAPTTRLLQRLIHSKPISVILTVLIFFTMPTVLVIVGFFSITKLLSRSGMFPDGPTGDTSLQTKEDRSGTFPDGPTGDSSLPQQTDRRF